jgi:predicted  nucleic acid-binding Zn-ribbon protein
MGKEINEYKIQIETNNRESETFRMKIQKLMNENTALNDEVRTAQDNLRLSANQMAKVTNELKITCN